MLNFNSISAGFFVFKYLKSIDLTLLPPDVMMYWSFMIKWNMYFLFCIHNWSWTNQTFFHAHHTSDTNYALSVCMGWVVIPLLFSSMWTGRNGCLHWCGSRHRWLHSQPIEASLPIPFEFSAGEGRSQYGRSIIDLLELMQDVQSMFIRNCKRISTWGWFKVGRC